MMQGDQPAEPTVVSKKKRKGENNKKKRNKGSKGKQKGKGKKRSRKKKHEEKSVEEGFNRMSTTLRAFQSLFQPTEFPLRPTIKSTTDTIFPTEVFDKTVIEMPTHEPDFTTVGPSVASITLPVSKVAEEVDQFFSRCRPPRHPLSVCRSNPSLP